MEKIERLEKILRRYKKVAIAFSGGIDSSFLLKKSLDVLGSDHVVAFVVDSELQPKMEYERAVSFAEDLGAKVQGITLSELSDPRIAANTPASWYYSKKMFYEEMDHLAKKIAVEQVLDGMIMDDQNDFRPGMKARKEAHVQSPLEEAGFYKAEIRQEAKKLGLNNWNKTSTCSVASRFPYGESLTKEKVERVLWSEAYLHQLGFDPLRVRSIEDLAKIEVEKRQFSCLMEQRMIEKIIAQLKQYGYQTITIDLEGFRSGRMNENLLESEKAKWQSY